MTTKAIFLHDWKVIYSLDWDDVFELSEHGIHLGYRFTEFLIKTGLMDRYYTEEHYKDGKPTGKAFIRSIEDIGPIFDIKYKIYPYDLEGYKYPITLTSIDVDEASKGWLVFNVEFISNDKTWTEKIYYSGSFTIME